MSIIGSLIAKLLMVCVGLTIQIGIIALFAESIKRARTKSGVELFMDCLPKIEKVSVIAFINWILQLILFSVPAFIMHLIMGALKFVVIYGVNMMDKTVVEKAVKANKAESEVVK